MRHPPRDPVAIERKIWNAEALRTLELGAQTPIVTDYVDWVSGKRHYRIFGGFLRSAPRKDLPVLQLGAGDVFHPLLPDIGYRNFWIADLAEVALDVARQRANVCGKPADYNYCQLDAHNLPFANNTAGLIVASSVVHHLNRSRFIPELVRILRPGGRALFLDPLLDYPMRAALLLRHVRRVDRGSDNPLSQSDISMMREAGLSVRVFRYGACSSLMARLILPFAQDRSTKIDIQNRLMSIDLAMANIGLYGRLLCNLAVLMVEKPYDCAT